MRSWGYLTCLDCMRCNPDVIRSIPLINEYIEKLIELIDMKAYGDPKIVDFGEDAEVKGITFVQLIETSLISGHLINQSNNACIDIFSCKPYDAIKARDFTQEFFKCHSIMHRLMERGIK
jgi:S-adenosylmethionine/arginine decarboxylase-like enzyme